MKEMKDLIPSIDELKKRVDRKPAPKPTAESKQQMEQMLAEIGYKNINPEVFSAIVGYGAIMLDNTAQKGLILSGGVGIGKTLGVQILAAHFKMPVFFPKMFASLFKELNGDYGELEEIVVTGGDFFHKPQHIVIDELGQKDTARHFGDITDIMEDVLEIRYRAFHKYGVKTIITTNLDDSGILSRYGIQINDRLNEICYFKAVNGRSLR